MFVIPLNYLIGDLFILATLGLVVGLGYFLQEVRLSSNTVRIRVNRKDLHLIGLMYENLSHAETCRLP